jgi:hypothetical protein
VVVPPVVGPPFPVVVPSVVDAGPVVDPDPVVATVEPVVPAVTDPGDPPAALDPTSPTSPEHANTRTTEEKPIAERFTGSPVAN